MVTPGSELKALNETVFDKDTLSNMVPSALTRNLGVEMIHSNSGL